MLFIAFKFPFWDVCCCLENPFFMSIKIFNNHTSKECQFHHRCSGTTRAQWFPPYVASWNALPDVGQHLGERTLQFAHLDEWLRPKQRPPTLDIAKPQLR